MINKNLRVFFLFHASFEKFFLLSNLGGIAISIGFLLLFCVMVMTRKYIDDMFHSLRTHVCLTWILAMVMHIVTGNIAYWGHFWGQFQGRFWGQILGTILRLIFGSISRSILGTIAIWGTIWEHFRDNRYYINDMFHSLRTLFRTHVRLTWILTMVMHIGLVQIILGTCLGTILRIVLGTISRLTLETISR